MINKKDGHFEYLFWGFTKIIFLFFNFTKHIPIKFLQFHFKSHKHVVFISNHNYRIAQHLLQWTQTEIGNVLTSQTREGCSGVIKHCQLTRTRFACTGRVDKAPWGVQSPPRSSGMRLKTLTCSSLQDLE